MELRAATRVERILFEGTAAVGVETAAGAYRATKEVPREHAAREGEPRDWKELEIIFFLSAIYVPRGRKYIINSIQDIF